MSSSTQNVLSVPKAQPMGSKDDSKHRKTWTALVSQSKAPSREQQGSTALVLRSAAPDGPLPATPRPEQNGTKTNLKVLEIPGENLGIKIRAESKDAEDIDVDIVAVHGIGADPEATWTYRHRGPGNDSEGESSGSKCTNWLADPEMLPGALPNARIMTFGYDSVWFGEAPARQTLEGVANKLLRRLHGKRQNCRDRPLIFIGHCFGGLVMQQAYVAASMHRQDYPGLYDSITGMVFLGTPHQGSNYLNAETPGQIYKAIVEANLQVQADQSLLKTMAHNNETLVNAVYNFTRDIGTRQSPPKLFCFFEERATAVGRIVGIRDRPLEFVVNETAGTLNGAEKQGLSLDHFNMNKFQSSKDDNYASVMEEIVKMVEASKTIMGARAGTSPTGIQSRSHSILRPTGSTMLPYPVVAACASRNGIVEKIKEKFKTTSKLALVGRCGSGKTHVAVEYAQDFCKLHADAQVYWVNASNAAEFESSYATISHRLHIRVGKGDNLMEAVQDFLKQDASGNWLMVFDGLDRDEVEDRDGNFPKGDNPGNTKRSLKSLFQYIPTGHPYGGSVLVTARSMSLATRMVNHRTSYVLELPARLSEDDSLLLLFGGKRPKMTETTKYPLKIADELGRSAAALALVRAYKGTYGSETSWKDCWESIHQSSAKAELRSNTTGVKETDDAICALAGIWHPLYSRLEETHSDAARLLQLLCLLDVQSMPLFPLNKFFDGSRSQRDQQIDILTKYGLLELSVNKNDIRLTAIVRLCVTSMLGDKKDEKDAIAGSALALVCETYPSAESQEYTTCKKLNTCAVAALSLETKSTDGRLKRANLLFKMAAYETHAGRYEVSIQYLKECLSLREQLPDTCRQEKPIIETKQRLEEAYTLQRKAEGRNSKVEDNTMNSRVNKSASDKKDGLARERKAKNTAEEINVSSNPEAVREASNFAASNHRRDLASNSNNIKNFQRILDWCQTKYGPNHLDTARQQYNLAISHDAHGQYEMAERLYKEAIGTMERQGRGKHNPESLRIMGSLARMYCEQPGGARLADAEDTLRTVLESQRDCLGLDHPDTLVTRHNAALVAQELRPNDLDSPAAELKSVLSAQAQLLGGDHPATLRTACSLALNNRLGGRQAEAEGLYRLCLDGQERVLGTDHPDTITTRLMLAELLRDSGKKEEAKREFVEALRRGEKLWGKEHPQYDRVRRMVLELG